MTTTISCPALPLEVLDAIFTHPLSQPTLHACTLVSHSWYSSSIAHLYAHPRITGPNFDAFVTSVCPAVNAHIRRNGLADLVKVLDMSRLVHNGRKSLTARLLGRMKGNLEEFVAPQATFAVNSLAALSKCIHLHTLDLSLVSEAIGHTVLFRAIQSLPRLHTLHIPRAFALIHTKPPTTASCLLTSESPTEYHIYPPLLHSLHLSGSLTPPCLLLTHPPLTLTSLTLSNLPRITTQPIFNLLTQLSAHLLYLQLGPNIPLVPGIPLYPGGAFPIQLPHLQTLCSSPQYLNWTAIIKSPSCLQNDNQTVSPSEVTFPRLRTLELIPSSRDDASVGLRVPFVLWKVMDMGVLPSLRVLRVHRRMGWKISGVDTGNGEQNGEIAGEGSRIELWRETSRDVRDLDELLKALAFEDGEEETDAGVVFFGMM